MCIFKEGKGKDGESEGGECIPHCTAQQYTIPTLTLPILSFSFLKNTHAYIELFFQRKNTGVYYDEEYSKSLSPTSRSLWFTV